MGKVIFRPFVGKNYATCGVFKKHIMILGESHYSDDNNPMLTNNVVRRYLDSNEDHEDWMKTFLKFERSLVGRETSSIDRANIWESLVFYNYLQVLMDGPREAGQKQQYIDSSSAFFQVLEQLQPDVIIVWGKRLWENIPWEHWTESEPITVEGYNIDNGYYTLSNGHIVKVVSVYHPSAGYDWKWWFKHAISKFL